MLRDRPGSGRRTAALISAHRGGSETAAEGSLEAYRAALSAGADLVEVDVRRRDDGVLVCAHDAPPTAESPLLADVVALVRRASAGLHVDVKESGYEADLVAAVGQVHPVFFTTGDDRSVAALRQLGAPACLTLGPALARRPWGERIRAVARDALPWRRIVGCEAIGVAAHFRFGWWGLRWWCEHRGLAVLLWTVNDDRRISRLLHARGVTVLVTDRPARAAQLRR